MKLAVCQMAICEKMEDNAKQIIHFMEMASMHNIALLCFPEMSLTGYTPTLLSKAELNLTVGKALKNIELKCNELNMGVIIGYGHRENDNLFNRAGVILPGDIKFTYDKMYLTEIEKEYFQQGKESLAFTFREATIGIIICRDQNYPLLTKELKDKGAQYIFVLSAHYYEPKEARWKLEKNRAIPITRAVENKVHVLLSNTVGTHIGMTSLGNSLIADPDGAVVVSAGEHQEGLLMLSTGGILF
jgi:predicted amidohydrolase